MLPLQSHCNMESGIYVSCLRVRKAVACRWVYHIKMNTGSIECYKAQLVVKGFSQKPHLDYTETFAPVAKFALLRTVLLLLLRTWRSLWTSPLPEW